MKNRSWKSSYVKILGNSSSQTWNVNDWTSNFFLNQFETFADMYEEHFYSPEVDFFWKVWIWQVFTTSLTFFPLHWMNKMQNANWFCIYHLKFDLKVSFNSIFKWNFFTRLYSETVCHTFHAIKLQYRLGLITRGSTNI